MSFVNVTLENGTKEKLDFEYGLRLPGLDGSSYRLKSAMRGGGNGVVFEATCYGPDGRDEGDCAVKLLKELSDKRQDRFRNEVRILKELDHEKITRCFDHGVVTLGVQRIDVPWIAMSLGHENLWQYMENNRPLPPKLAVGVATQICNALMHVHERSIIHRDLKPANIVWNTEDDRENIFLIDFGIAKFVGEDVSGRPMDHFTSLKEFVGPSNFCSPELLAYARDKRHPVDHRSDLFQFGLLLWFLVTNKVLAGVPAKKSDPTGGKIHSLVLDLIAMEPDDRLPTANDVLERLNSIS